MIVILEGENKCGKTTIANYLVRHHKFYYYKCSQPKEDPYIEYMRILKDIEKNGKNAVIDRFMYGEFVYGPIYRGKSELTSGQKINIELKLLSMNAHLIYCYDKKENIKKRFEQDGEDFAKKNLIMKTLKLFNTQYQESPLQKITHTMKGKNDILKNGKLKQILFDNCLKDKFKIKSAIGNIFNPRLIIIGDSHNDNIKIKYKKYFQPFDFGISSKFLFESIKKAKINLNKIAIVNSNSIELKRICNISHYIIALGKNASKKLTKLKINHYQLNHPAYENRFYHHSGDFRKQLKKIWNIIA